MGPCPLSGTPLSPPQDQLAADMYSFMAKEGEYGNFFVTVSAGPTPCRSLVTVHPF